MESEYTSFRSAVGGLDTTQFEEADEKLQEIHTKLTAISKELEGERGASVWCLSPLKQDACDRT